MYHRRSTQPHVSSGYRYVNVQGLSHAVAALLENIIDIIVRRCPGSDSEEQYVVLF